MTTPNFSRPAIAAPGIRHAAPALLVSGLALAMLGPFGTALTMHGGARVAYWLVNCALIGGLNVAALHLAQRALGAKQLPLWVIAAISAATALPGAFIAQACLAFWAPDSLPYMNWLELFAQCVFLNVTLTFLTIGVLGKLKAAPLVPAVVAQQISLETSPLAERLPFALRQARILALEAEDHYLRVHTERGSALIHMRLSDAEHMLKQVDGLRVHRSFWAARAALQNVERKRGAG